MVTAESGTMGLFATPQSCTEFLTPMIESKRQAAATDYLGAQILDNNQKLTYQAAG